MTTATARRIGAQRPRLSSLPADIANTDAGDEVIEFAERYGLVLDDWQRWCVRHMCAERADGSWAATQAVLLVPRQAGKGAVLEAIELAALFLWDYEHIIYSAHLQKTSTDHMRRVRRHIEANPDLKRLARVKTGKGDEMVERDTGAILEFLTRSKKTSRGGSPGMVVFDEALFLQEDEIQAMVPALSAQSMNEDTSAQMIYTSSAPVASSTVLHRLRTRGIEERPRRMFFAEWSALDDCDPADRDNWYLANPGLGIRISEEWVEDNEFGTLSPEAFATERLGIREEPIGLGVDPVIPGWHSLGPPEGVEPAAWSSITSHKAWALAVSPIELGDQWASLGVAGRRVDGGLHVEWMEHRKGTAWVVPRCVELQKASKLPLRVHKSGPEGALIDPLRAAKVEVVEVSDIEVGYATGQFIAAGNADPPGLFHLGQPSLDKALAGAVLRTTANGAAVWSQRNSSVEITPLLACTVALGGVPVVVGAWAGSFTDLDEVAEE